MNAPAARWSPSVTVAAIVENDGRYLLVEEHTPEGLRLNNPAGHLEPGESPEQGAKREALEETACPFEVEALLGIYLWRFQRGEQDISYLRFAYCGRAGAPIAGRALDVPIVRTLWMTLAEVRDSAERHRSPLVLRCIEDHAAGRRWPTHLVAVDPRIGPSPAAG